MKPNQNGTVQPIATSPQNCTERPARFLMTCAAAADVYLLLRREDGSVLVCTEMEPQGGSRWGLTLRLRPATYRYRYYVQSDRVINYVSPADVDVCPVQMDGFDAVMTVTAEKNTVPCSAAAVCGTAHRCHRRCES